MDRGTGKRTIRRRGGWLFVLGTVAALVVTLAGPAAAQVSGSYTPNPIPVTPGQDSAEVVLEYDFGGANTAVFFDVCKKASSDPNFNYTRDCDRGAVDAANGSAQGAGTKTYLIAVGSTFGSVYLGQTIDMWGCYPNGWEVPDGFEAAAECWIRVSEGNVFNNDTAIDMPIVWSVGGSEIPEAPVVVLPLLLGALVVGGVVVVRSRRRSLA